MKTIRTTTAIVVIINILMKEMYEMISEILVDIKIYKKEYIKLSSCYATFLSH